MHLKSIMYAGDVVMSPSRRAAVCRVGDSLEIRCTTTDRFLTWRVILTGTTDRITRTLSSTIVNPEIVVINTTVFTFSRTSELGSTPLVSNLEIGSTGRNLNGTQIVCMEVGASSMKDTTTVYIIKDNHGGSIYTCMIYLAILLLCRPKQNTPAVTWHLAS